MARTLQCQKCRHFVSIPMPNGDPTLYFCGNDEARLGPNPIGFLKIDAPACALYSKRGSVSRGTNASIVVIAPSSTTVGDSFSRLHRKAVDIAVFIGLLVGLASWLVSEVRPEWIGFIAHVASKIHF